MTDPITNADQAIELCIAICEQQQRDFLDPQYATPQPVGSIQERFAVGECIKAMRKVRASLPASSAVSVIVQDHEYWRDWALASGFVGRYSDIVSSIISAFMKLGLVEHSTRSLKDQVASPSDGGEAHRYAVSLLFILRDKHFPEATQLVALEDTAGVLTQIDNITSGLVRPPEPVSGAPANIDEYDPLHVGHPDKTDHQAALRPQPNLRAMDQLLSFTFDIAWRFHEGVTPPRKAEIDEMIERMAAYRNGDRALSDGAAG